VIPLQRAASPANQVSPMPTIALVKLEKDYRQLEVVRLYKQLFCTGLKESSEQVSYLIHQKGYEIPLAEADFVTAAHFVYTVRKFGLTCQLRSGLSAPLQGS
jgi:hypothetical protein